MERNQTSITSREREVLHLIAYEHSSKEIAQKLFISCETVNSHRKNLMSKLDVKNTAGMVRVAFEKGILCVSHLACIIAFFFVNSVSAQVANDENIYYELQTSLAFWWKSTDDGVNGESEMAFNYRAKEDTDGIATDIGSGPLVSQACIAWSGDCEGFCQSPVVFNQIIAETMSASKGIVDFHVYAFEDDSNFPGSCAATSPSHEEEAFTLFDIREIRTPDSPNVWQASFLNEPIAFPYKFQAFFRSTWRYEHGEKNSPLDFDVIGLEEKTHINSNLGSPAGAESKMGYNNNWPFQPSKDVTYIFKVEEYSKSITISTDYAETTSDTHLFLLNNQDSVIANNNDGGSNFNGFTSKITTTLKPGVYKIIVESFSTFASSGEGRFKLSVLGENVDAPDNDVCSSAITLNTNTSDCSTTVYNSLGATGSILLTQCIVGANHNDEVWFQFTPTMSLITINVTGDSLFEPVFELYKDICPSSSSEIIGCAGAQGEMLATYSGSLIPDSTYFIRVYDFQSGFQGEQSFTICINDNDECLGAINLPVGNGSCTSQINGTNEGATDSGISHNNNAPCDGYNGGDIWFKFTAPTSGNVILETSLDGQDVFDSVIEVYDICGENRTSIGCADGIGNTSGFFSKLSLNNLTGGQVYYVAVWEYNNDAVGTFNICAYELPSFTPCTDGYTGNNALTGTQSTTETFVTDQSIESSQAIDSGGTPISVNYECGDSNGNSIIMQANFEVKVGATFTAIIGGCGGG